MQIVRLFFLTLIFYSIAANAVLEVEVRGGYQSASPIAIVPFGWQQANAAPVNIASIVREDLQRSGLFSPLPFNQLPENPSSAEAINFERWKNTSAEQLVIGQIMPTATAQYDIVFQIFDVFSGREMLGYKFTTDKKNLRRVAHQISDLIYEKLTGSKGAFDTLIAYVLVKNDKKAENRVYTLAVADSDGYDEQVILKSRQPIMSPAWSPDGLQLAYVSFEDKRSVVYVQELKSGKRKIVADYQGINSAPRWSPDGKRLALTLSKDGNAEIYIVYIGSGITQRITNHYGIDTEPFWSPDGHSLVFTSDRAGKPQIYKIDVNQQGRAGSARRLTYEGDYNARATVSPDGKLLALVSRDRGNYRIALLNLATNELQIMTQSRLDESPTFSPNSKMILYATELRGRGVLEALGVDGTNSPQRLRVLTGDVREPAWSPYRTNE